ncbi:hypothetical protein [Marinicrinis lubricantis]|uniref:Zinc-finger domain-containing protein n=1 Tax=Marinicrinis lubricantis TaxID=2086470 RepID=A0ABW1ILZ9_9BACL
MKCDAALENIYIYWDLPENDLRRLQVDHHLKHCSSCMQEFTLWEASRSWIEQTNDSEKVIPSEGFADKVMNQIYQTEPWKVSITERLIAFTKRQKFLYTACIAFLLAVFSISLLVFALPQEEQQTTFAAEWNGLPVVSSDQTVEFPSRQGIQLEGITVASVGDPYLLSMDGLQNNPNYYMIFAIGGIIVALLLMNWLSRTRS